MQSFSEEYGEHLSQQDDDSNIFHAQSQKLSDVSKKIKEQEQLKKEF